MESVSITSENILQLDIFYFDCSITNSKVQNHLKKQTQHISVKQLQENEESSIFDKFVDICYQVTQIDKEFIGIMYRGQLLTENDFEFLGNIIENSGNKSLKLFVINLNDYESKLDQAEIADKQYWVDFRHQYDLSYLSKASLKYKQIQVTSSDIDKKKSVFKRCTRQQLARNRNNPRNDFLRERNPFF
eukprot:403338905